MLFHNKATGISFSKYVHTHLCIYMFCFRINFDISLYHINKRICVLCTNFPHFCQISVDKTMDELVWSVLRAKWKKIEQLFFFDTQ